MPAAPRAPVAPGEHEVPVCGDGLLVGRVTVAEEPALVRAHLEEAEVLPVPRRRRQARLAPGDGDRLSRVASEDRVDRDPRRRLRQPARPPCGRSAVGGTRSPSSRRRAAASRGRAPPAGPPGSRPSSGESDGSGSSGSWCELGGRPRPSASCASSVAGRCSRSVADEAWVSASPLVAAAACVTRTSAHRPTSRAFSSNLLDGDSGPPTRAARVSRSEEPYLKRHELRRKALQKAQEACHDRNRQRQRIPVVPRHASRLRGRDSNPNFLVQSQASYR